MQTRFEMFSKEWETNEYSSRYFNDFLMQCIQAINKLEGQEVPLDVEFWSWYQRGSYKTIWERLCEKEKIIINDDEYYQIEFSYRKKVFARWTPRALIEYGYCTEDDYNEYIKVLKTEFEDEVSKQFITHTWSVDSFNGFLSQCRRAINKLEGYNVSTKYDFWSTKENGESKSIWQRLRSGEAIVINDGFYCIDFHYKELVFAGWSSEALKNVGDLSEEKFNQFLHKKGIIPYHSNTENL